MADEKDIEVEDIEEPIEEKSGGLRQILDVFGMKSSISDAIIDYGENWKEYSLGSFTENKSGFTGAKEGIDAADVIDIPLRVAGSIYRAGEFPIRKAMSGVIKQTDKISKAVGEPIMNQDEADEFFNRYTSDMKEEHKGRGYKRGIEFGEHGKPFSSNSYSAFMGTQITPRKEGGGVEPITAAEEIRHARGDWENNPIYEANLMPKIPGKLAEYFYRLVEEGRAKGMALKDVYKNEGGLEAAASVPSLASTYATYMLPHGAEIFSGRDEKKEYMEEIGPKLEKKYGTGEEGFMKYIRSGDPFIGGSEEAFKLNALKKGGWMDQIRYYMATKGDSQFKESMWSGKFPNF